MITTGDATIGAHSMYKGLAIGGTLYDGTPNEDATIDNFMSYVNVKDPNSKFNFNGGLTTGATTVPSSMWARFAFLAEHAVNSESNGKKVVVVTSGGTYNMYDFRNGGQGEDNGNTLVIFNTAQDITLTKTPDGRQFGPTIIAPFAKVTVLGDAGFIDGSVYAKTFVTTGGNQGALQLHGDTYTGSIQCNAGGTPPTTEAPNTASATTPAPTEAPGSTTAATTSAGAYCNWSGCNGVPEGGDWCNALQDQCVTTCGGTWCTPEPAQTEPAPTDAPTKSPTKAPTAGPTKSPTKAPTASPTKAPTAGPTASPTKAPTAGPTKSPTKAPTASPTKAPVTALTEAPVANQVTTATSGGDPHFKTWTGKKFDYHGECDLVLVDNPSFADGLGMRLHIRTTRIKYYSYIEQIALQIGSDILEFNNDLDNFLINGEKVAATDNTVGGFEVHRYRSAISVRLDKTHQSKAKIDFLRRKNGFPYVKIDGGNTSLLEGSLGLLGEWRSGKMLSRDGVTEMDGSTVDGWTAYALEWQVRDTEPVLFTSARFPQFPAVCTPPKKMLGNRLGDSHMRKAAEDACEAWKEDKEECIFDVMASRNIDSAEAVATLTEESDVVTMK